MKKLNLSKNKKRIQEFLEKMDLLFCINNYDWSIIWKEKKNDKGFAAEINYNEKYQTLDLNIFPTFFEHTLSQQRKMLLHELIHSITLPNKDALHDFLDGKFITPQEINKINETETSKIENIFDGLLRGRLKYAVKAYKEYLK